MAREKEQAGGGPIINYGEPRPSIPGLKEAIRTPQGKAIVAGMVGDREDRRRNRELIGRHQEAFRALNAAAQEKGFNGILIGPTSKTISVESPTNFFRFLEAVEFGVPKVLMAEHVSPDGGRTTYLNYVRVAPSVLPTFSYMLDVDRDLALKGMAHVMSEEREHVHGREHAVAAGAEAEWKASRESVLNDVGGINPSNMEKITDYFAAKFVVAILIKRDIGAHRKFAQDYKETGEGRLSIGGGMAELLLKFLPPEALDGISDKATSYMRGYLAKVAEKTA